jgi:multidrug efflux pump subunit AcrB
VKRAWLLVATMACKHHDVVEHERRLAGITVEVALPGASSTTMASAVTTPLERQFGQIAHLERLESHSTPGATKIVLELSEGADLDQAAADVQKAINAASNLLPRTLPAPPIYMKVGREGAVLRFALHGVSWVELSKSADQMAQKLSQVGGVGRVTICGEERETVHVIVDPVALASQGHTLDEVRSELSNPSVDFAAPNTMPLTRDVATIERGGSPPTCFAFTAQRVVAVTVTPQPGADLESVRTRLEAQLRQLAAELPPAEVLETLPRTRPVAYELHVDPDVARPKRLLDVQALVAELPADVAVQALAELGATDPDTVDLRIVPKGDEAALDTAVQRIAALHGFEVHDRHDHVVGLSGADPIALAAQLDVIVKALASHKTLRVSPIGTRQMLVSNIVLDRDRMATLAIPLAPVEESLLALTEQGMLVSTVFTQLDQIPVMLSVRGELSETIDRVYVHTASGALVPLSQVASTTRTSEPAEVIHEGQFPWLGVRVAGPLDEIEAVLATLPTPPDVHRELREPR